MPLSPSHGSFVRRLSVQPEESGTDLDGEQDTEQRALPDEPLYDGQGAVMPLSFHASTPLSSSPVHFTCGPGSTEHDGDELDSSYLRKLSVASTGSIKSVGSLSSTCSAPGGISIGGSENGAALCRKDQCFDMQPMNRRVITSRPSFISLCSIVSETSEVPRKLLPAPLQVELDLMQRNGIEGDEPKHRSHLPIMRCPSDYDISEMDMSTVSGLRQSFFKRNSQKSLVSGFKHIPSRIRKMSTENRFDIYSVSDETREQLKRLYVY